MFKGTVKVKEPEGQKGLRRINQRERGNNEGIVLKKPGLREISNGQIPRQIISLRFKVKINHCL